MKITQEYVEAATEHAIMNFEVQQEFGRPYSQLRDHDYKRNPDLMRRWEKTYCRYRAAVEEMRRASDTERHVT